MQIITFSLTVIAFLWHHKTRGYFGAVEETGCHNTEFRLSCGSSNGNIIIFEATFAQNVEPATPLQTSCGDLAHSSNQSTWNLQKLKTWENFVYKRNSSNDTVEVSFRHVINRRCSGVNYCSFVLNEDFEAASGLGPGAVYLRYACVDDVHASRACNSNIDVTAEGFVRTPGYPEYYIGDTTCVWKLRAPPPQRVRIAFLDISLRGLAPYEVTCLDWLRVSENGLNLLSICGDVIEDTLIVSDGSALNVTFKSSSKTLFPKRGFLFHYKAVGCPLLQKPRDGYLVNRNDTFAHYRCCVGFIFPDTLSRDKTLKCYNENTWDGVILDCVNVTEILDQKNNSDLAVGARREMENSDFFKDIIIPSIVLCVLFIGNGFVLYFIYQQRNKWVPFIVTQNSKNGNERNVKTSVKPRPVLFEGKPITMSQFKPSETTA